MKKGFTLAEVLITLGIIGIVAAMTMPGLVQNYQKKVTATQLKKNFTTLHEIIRLSEKDNGEVGEWSFPEGRDDNANNSEFFKKYLEPYLKVVGNYSSVGFVNIDGRNTDVVGTWHVLPDGSSLGLFYNTAGNYIWIFIDVNGKNKPNRLGKDIFMSELVRKKRLIMWGHDHAGRGRNEVFNDPGYACKKGKNSQYSGGYCGALIQADGWEIKDDYPW